MVAGAGAVVILHEAGVLDARRRGRGGGARAAGRLLHDDGEDEAVVDFGRDGDALDRRVQVADLLRRGRRLGVDGAGLLDDGDVHGEPGWTGDCWWSAG